MRKRPDQKKLEENFINNAQAFQDDRKEVNNPSVLKKEEKNKEKLKQLDWPLSGPYTVVFEEGSSLRKPINLPLKEFEWNTLEKHTKRLGVSKSEWIRYAMFSTMEKERTVLDNE